MKTKRHYRFRAGIWHTASLVGLVLPLIIWVIINRVTYIQHGTTKLAIGGMLTMAFIFALLKGAFKNIHPNLAIVINLGVLLAIVGMLDAILQDMFYIILAAIIGYIIYIPFNFLGDKNWRYAEVYQEENIREDVRAGRV